MLFIDRNISLQGRFADRKTFSSYFHPWSDLNINFVIDCIELGIVGFRRDAHLRQPALVLLVALAHAIESIRDFLRRNDFAGMQMCDVLYLPERVKASALDLDFPNSSLIAGVNVKNNLNLLGLRILVLGERNLRVIELILSQQTVDVLDRAIDLVLSEWFAKLKLGCIRHLRFS